MVLSAFAMGCSSLTAVDTREARGRGRPVLSRPVKRITSSLESDNAGEVDRKFDIAHM